MIPKEQKKIKEFRAKHNNTQVGTVTVDQVRVANDLLYFVFVLADFVGPSVCLVLYGDFGGLNNFW